MVFWNRTRNYVHQCLYRISSLYAYFTVFYFLGFKYTTNDIFQCERKKNKSENELILAYAI